MRFSELFLSTLPVWGATFRPSQSRGGSKHFYPRSPCGERRPLSDSWRIGYRISIHVPREGNDVTRAVVLTPSRNFYPRSPRGERPSTPDFTNCIQLISIRVPRVGSDVAAISSFLMFFRFLSTLPVWGATLTVNSCPLTVCYFYPRSPRGERRQPLLRRQAGDVISIHVPREGNDLLPWIFRCSPPISIHVPREGNDYHH